MKTKHQEIRVLFCRVNGLGEVLEGVGGGIEVVELEERFPGFGMIGRGEECETEAVDGSVSRFLGHPGIASDAYIDRVFFENKLFSVMKNDKDVPAKEIPAPFRDLIVSFNPCTP
jgi:hypothetical protein